MFSKPRPYSGDGRPGPLHSRIELSHIDRACMAAEADSRACSSLASDLAILSFDTTRGYPHQLYQPIIHQ
ncbi:hypothetical protein H696_05772 [Fonticula alba]|uniref:Uncharacterized protein n=1 Tax=Fonticula alba TaxID=691883 RepID=A0A058Z0M8_FONAL|nr:hypothetical protein H696_05772 [Fonticula alba]KCV67815.1 hypothetical protein H696_05772 [Fonticula alba]|eukprot:XP_009497846.1 hypothetical protein H696_05772 [Fonticula alba]